ncbi:putative disease resistance protein RGA3 [Quercus robur]|uniref:putative disease resistance protein RGA3 n=1 Tax=Quercus robur TaxID=38942 RepID=UPI002163A5B3|nr:putative disease resistance protein RGA3 [Quercus robur]XP_050284769.1 putative disease resistance protein RGA3 [Quercus robur]XP_050284770.1 putative disease resistance protein RGA3 [Quercus robur]XP_050284771.1 putative disease resistance protein RGA3 [Quercus robur]XP_050284772.1 putative disease resistance protein RGA3 [Quercus robur]
MAEAILFGLVQKMIENLGSQTFQEIGSLWGVKGELEKIKNTVSSIQAVLLDAAEKQSHDHQVKDWLQKLNDAVYDADDLLSEFSTEAMRRRAVSGNKVTKEVRTFFSKSNQLAFHGKMSSKIKAMRQKLNAIAEDRKNFRLEEYHVETNVVSRKREPTHSFVREEKVIGREDDRKAVIDLLLDSNVEENVSVIPIVGIGGLGKTTLAQYVYNDEKVKNYFELKMWVCVSDIFELKIIIEKIIASATGNAPGNLEMDQLQSQIREKIDRKKYLLVLDDVWNEDRGKWLNLINILMGGSKGSKIIITTRSKLVAKITHTVSPYILNGLSEEQSWSLFKQVAFSKGQVANNPTLVTIGREIVKICQGVPLAIMSIGNVLYCEETASEWLLVKDNLLANVIEGNEIYPILKLSYDNLPSHLKNCFVFCSLFPKDYEMDKDTVIQLWIAQGFIQSSNKNQQLEDVGDKYFKDLLWRSFFEEVIDSYGLLKYKMHDLIHDLAESIAGEECKLLDFHGKNINEKNRHVSCPFFIDLSFIETLKSSVKSDKIRTFLQTCEGYKFNALDESTLNTLILSFKRLRALDLHELKITRVPNSIGKLMHLKYLDLSFNEDIETLPDSITTLLNLQTLKLCSCEGLKELPKDIRELVSLRHLYNDGCDNLSHMPCGLGQMTSLQTLPLFIVSTSSHTGGLGELRKLNLQGTLEISHLERLEETKSESIVVNLREKQHLEKLILKWDHQDQVDNNEDEKLLENLRPHRNLKHLEVHQYKGVKFSSWVYSLINLVDLRIENCERCRYLPPLSHLPSLKSLMLAMMNDLEYISDKDMSKEVFASSTTLSATFFPSLKSLTIEECPNLKGWWGRTGRDLVATTSASTPDHKQDQSHNSLPLFPLLSSLWIRNCPEMTSMPLFPNLEERLYLNNVRFKPLQETMSVSSSSLSSSSPLSKLNEMELYSIEDIESLPAEWALHSLKELYIGNCPRLTSMSGAVRNLTSLCSLSIDNCEEFDPLRDMHDDGMEWRCLNCVRDLRFEGIPKMKSLPVGLQCISTLKELRIPNCPNLMTLPELTSLEFLWIKRCEPNLTSLLEISCLTSLQWLWIEDLPNLITFPESIRNPISLEKLYIDNCPNLTTLPDDGFLKSLRNLRIRKCPQLEEKYKNKIGKDFPNLEIIWATY